MGVLTTEKMPALPAIVQSVRAGIQPLQVAVLGPPGSGHTKSILRMMAGVQRVRQGPVVLIDTEAGRSKKYSPKPGEAASPPHTYEFLRMDLNEPYRADRCLAAIKAALALNPAAIGFDSLSDEHEGEGGYMEWAASEVPNVGGNEWAAYNKPAAARKRLVTFLQHTTVPLFLSFRGKEKSEQKKIDDPKHPGRKKKVIVQLGWMPVAPLLILKGCDLTCILPWDSKGTPVWKSDRLGEDFIRKWPDYLVNIISAGQLTEDTGERLARWAMGGDVKPASRSQPTQATPQPTPEQAPGTAPLAPGETAPILDEIREVLRRHKLGSKSAAAPVQLAFGADWGGVCRMDADGLRVGLAALKLNLDGVAAMRERQPGEDDDV